MTLFASVLHLDRPAIKALKITDPYSLHRVVYDLFDDVRNAADKQASASSGILYAEQGGDFNGRRILMLSNRQPATAVKGLHGQVASKPIPEAFLSHGQYHFKVVVNPTQRESATGKLRPLKERGAIADWFCHRALTRWGFSVAPAHLQVGQITVEQFFGKGQQPITLAKAQLQGTLTVTDPEAFQRSFTHGIGRGKAFGCGLLQLVPTSHTLFD